MRSQRIRTFLALIAAVVLTGRPTALPSGAPPQSGDSSAAGFTAHTIDTGLSGGYQAVVADLNRDGKPDIIALASDLKELRWYENPGWEKHILVTGVNQPINAAAYDVDGDGIPEIALAHEFSDVYAQSLGIVSILTHQGDPTGPWSIKEIDRVPTSHRLRFADIEGTGKKVLVNFPLIGSKAIAPDYRDHVSLLMYRPGEWKREVSTDAEEGVVHGLLPTVWDGGKRESLLSASFRGVYALQFAKGQWKRTLVVKGDPADWPKSGSSDVIVGYLGRERFLATIEPWHGNKVVIYRRDKDTWKRHVIDETITDGHAIVAGDFDGNGQDELVVGERQGKRSVYLYRVTNAKEDTWSKQPLDDGGMAAAGCAVADLNADKRPDVVCIGTATANLKWYENRR
jgi:FG-GAP-like repeat